MCFTVTKHPINQLKKRKIHFDSQFEGLSSYGSKGIAEKTLSFDVSPEEEERNVCPIRISTFSR